MGGRVLVGCDAFWVGGWEVLSGCCSKSGLYMSLVEFVSL